MLKNIKTRLETIKLPDNIKARLGTIKLPNNIKARLETIKLPDNIKNQLQTIKLPKLDLKKKDAHAVETKIEAILPYDVTNYGDIVSFDGIPKGHLFCWDEIPGNDSKKLIEFLTHKFGVDWVKKAQIEKNDDGKTIRVTSENIYISLKLNEKQTYSLCWDDIPGKASGQLIDFLKQKFSIDWVKTAKIEKIDNDNTLKVYTDKNFIFLKLGTENTKINLEIDNDKTIRVTGIKKSLSLELKEEQKYLFCWNEIPGNDSERFINYLKQKFGIDWVKTAKIEKIDNNETLKVYTEKKNLFSWDEIPGNDNDRLIEFIEQKYRIDWVKKAKIEKIDAGRTVNVYTEKKSLNLRLNDEKTKVNIKIEDLRTDELSVEMENNKLNIYEKKYLLLKFNNDKTRLNLKIDDGRSDDFIVKTENNVHNIHEKTKVNLIIDDGRTDEFNVKIESGKINIYPLYEELERYWVNEPFSFISILLNKTFDEYIYYIVEPQLTPFELTLLNDVYERSRDILSYEDLTEGVDKKALLTRKVKEIIDKYIHNFEVRSFYKILYFILRNNIGFGRIDPLINDEMIEDISCSGPNIPVFLFHRKYENIKTSLVFEEEELNSFVFILAQQSGKNISVAKPYLDATLSDGSRLQETLGREITTRGSSFTIRKFKEEPSTPIDLIIWKTFNVEMMAYMWLAIENNKSLILAGGTASGKTTSLNSMSLFIPHKAKIVTLEDTREIQLFHENWVAGLTRESFTTGGKGTVDMYELLRQGLRQRPEYLIVGEVRGKEALTLFQAMSTGHTTYSTMHAGSIQAAINRLENEPINVPRVMITALDILCVQGATYLQGKRVRRILNVIEIVDLDPETRSLNTLETFTWNPLNDEHNELRESHVMESIREKRGWTKKQLEQALDRRKKVLAYMVDRNIRDYNSVVQIIKDFQISQEKLMKKLMIEDSPP